MIQLASWNVKDLNRHKLEDPDFVNIVKMFDLFTLVET